MMISFEFTVFLYVMFGVVKNNIFACGRCRHVNKEVAQRVHTATKNIAQRDTAKNEGH
jgi:hypothetical protein